MTERKPLFDPIGIRGKIVLTAIAVICVLLFFVHPLYPIMFLGFLGFLIFAFTILVAIPLLVTSDDDITV